jgi:integral membrane protein
MTMNIQTLRIVGLLEGISFLLLLFIAMPMKYLLDNPILVKYVGMGHGVLFILFLIVLFTVCEKQKWSITMFILGLIASILPFGTFVFDRKLKNFEQPIAEPEI